MPGWSLVLAAVLIFTVFIIFIIASRASLRFQDLGNVSSTPAPKPPPRPCEREDIWDEKLDCTYGHGTKRLMTAKDLDAFFQVWNSVSAHFDSDPRTAIVYADLMITDLIRHSCWHPCESGIFGHDQVRNKYIEAHKIVIRVNEGPLNPDELKRAMTLYTAVAEDVAAHERTLS